MASWIIVCAALFVVDGDTVKCDGENLRLLGGGVPFVRGIDTPEIKGRKCDRELSLGRAARDRLKELLRGKRLKIVAEGYDRTRDKRPLVNIYLPDGREVGGILLREGHARPWRPGFTNDWCTGWRVRPKRQE